jgi:hypothetical protein
MKHIKLFEAFNSITGDLPSPIGHILLDGTSSSGKSAALKNITPDWCVLAVDSFYNLMYEEIGKADFGNGDKLTLSQIYPGCPYGIPKRDDEGWEETARWYMAQEVQWGKILKEELKDARGMDFGRNVDQSNVVYDDVQGTIIQACKEAGLKQPLWLLIHAPLDHLLLNIERRKGKDGRDPKGVFMGAYCFKYEALQEPGGVDPTKSWTREDVQKLLGKRDWTEEFLTKIGMVDEGEYWMHTKPQPEGSYDVIVNTRNDKGNQKSLNDLSSEVLEYFKE